MNLSERVTADLMNATKSGETEKVSTLRMLRSSIKNAEIAEGGALSEDRLVALIQKEIKQRRESAESFRSGGREESAAKEEREARLLEGYLPTQLSDDELSRIVQETISGLGEGAQMGQVIGQVRSKVGTGADGSRIAATVREHLGG